MKRGVRKLRLCSSVNYILKNKQKGESDILPPFSLLGLSLAFGVYSESSEDMALRL